MRVPLRPILVFILIAGMCVLVGFEKTPIPRTLSLRLHVPSSPSTISFTTHSCPPSSVFSGINLNVPSNPKGELEISPEFKQHLASLAAIPKIIHLAWNDRKALQSNTTLAKQGIRRLVDLNQDWELNFAEDREMDDYIQRHLSPEDWELLRVQHVVERADVWRLLVTIYEGGFYQDIDRVYSRPLNQILKPDTKMLLPLGCGWNFAQDLMCSAPCNNIHLATLQLNLERRRVMAQRQPSQEKRKFNRSRADILSMGPMAYFHAATWVMFGQMLTYNKTTAETIFALLKECPLLETYCETRCNTITHPWDPVCWNVTRDQLHVEQKQVKWLDGLG